METKIFRTLLFAVGSLPFWTGERKLKQFLRGEAGSFWNDPAPLKPTYLEHHFFGGLEDAQQGGITRALQRLKQSGYLTRERLSSDLPHQVIKLTGKGVFQYYNLLVTEDIDPEPTWWIHHLSRLERRPKQPIRTGGEVVEFSGRLYLSQTPAFVEPEARVRDDGSIRLIGKDEQLQPFQPGQSVSLESAVPVVKEGVELGIHPETDVQSLPASDLRRRLTHFSPREAMPDDPNPYLLRGTLETLNKSADGRLQLILRNDKNEVEIRLPANQVGEEQELTEGDEYVLGPVKRDSDDPEKLTLQPTGEIQKYEPFG